MACNALSNSEKSANILETYKNMSNLDIEYVKRFINMPEQFDLIMKFENLMKDTQFYEQETYEEVSRDE